MSEIPQNPEITPIDGSVVTVLRNSLDSLHQLPDNVRKLESVSTGLKEFTEVHNSSEVNALFDIQPGSVSAWLDRNDDVVDDYEEPPAAIWPVKSEYYDEYLVELNDVNHTDIINSQAETLSGAIGKFGSDYYVDVFRQAIESYGKGEILARVEGGYLTWFWHDMTDGYIPDTDVDFHTLLANEIKMRFLDAGADDLAAQVDSSLIYDTFIQQAGDQGAFTGEIEKSRMIYWAAANAAVNLFDTDPTKLGFEDYWVCLDLCEDFAVQRDKNSSIHGRDFDEAYASDIGVDAKAVKALLSIGSKFPYQIIKPNTLRSQSGMFQFDIKDNSIQVPNYNDDHLVVLSILGYLSGLREAEKSGSNRDEATAALLELVMSEDFMPRVGNDMETKEAILRRALGDDSIVF